MHQHSVPFSKTVFLLAAVGGLIWASAGDLDPPPGEIRPTMKSLTEVEPRSALSPQDLPTTISAPGSYYLAGDYTETSGRTAIHITAGGVTLDLNGYTLYGNQVGTIAISIATGVADTTIRNGHVRNWLLAGIDGEEAEGVHVEGVRVDTVAGIGFTLGGGSVVADCSARRCAIGFEVTECTITRCIARNNTSMGFGVTGGTVTECTATYNGVRGFQVGTATLARNCTARHNEVGFSLNARGVVSDCIATDNTGAGIRATGSDNRIEGNDVTNNAIGLDIDAAGNSVAGNLVKGNDDNYDFVSGNQLNILLCEIPETINWPATVRLAGTLTGSSGSSGLSIHSDNVTVDLDGHALIGGTDTLIGILVAVGHENIVIRNGTVRDWGSVGIGAAYADDSRLTDVRATDNGDDGIKVGNTCQVEECTTARNGDHGIVVSADCRVTGCISKENGGDGIRVGSRSHVWHNTCSLNGLASGDGSGIHALYNDNHIEDNRVVGGHRGLDIDGSANYVAGNFVKGNADNYDFADGNFLNILLCEIPESIDWPAQVTLAGSLTGTASDNGIDVSAHDVSIDLAGHALVGVPNSENGIRVWVHRTNVSIRNGTIRDWGGSGVSADEAKTGSLSSLFALNNAVTGLQAGWNFTISDCIAKQNGGRGIFADTGSVITNCSADSNGGHGILAKTSCVIQGCASRSNGGSGIRGFFVTVTNCSVTANSEHGIEATDALIRSNLSAYNTYQQIYDDGTSTIIENHEH